MRGSTRKRFVCIIFFCEERKAGEDWGVQRQKGCGGKRGGGWGLKVGSRTREILSNFLMFRWYLNAGLTGTDAAAGEGRENGEKGGGGGVCDMRGDRIVRRRRACEDGRRGGETALTALWLLSLR